MSIIDFLIGLTLMNAMPHFVLGIWKGRILSGFGTSPRGNLAYSMLNFSASIGLFWYEYGLAGLAHNGFYAGGLAILLAYFATAQLLYRHYHPHRAT
ncbi:MAG: hypothetical protein K0V04_18505 [Deltaproteobacteria bacterium]|nr:hypothetical protein [Deltaproteobacteria bacterium]